MVGTQLASEPPQITIGTYHKVGRDKIEVIIGNNAPKPVSGEHYRFIHVGSCGEASHDGNFYCARMLSKNPWDGNSVLFRATRRRENPEVVTATEVTRALEEWGLEGVLLAHQQTVSTHGARKPTGVHVYLMVRREE